MFGERDSGGRGGQKAATPPPPTRPPATAVVERTSDQILADRDVQHDEVFEETNRLANKNEQNLPLTGGSEEAATETTAPDEEGPSPVAMAEAAVSGTGSMVSVVTACSSPGEQRGGGGGGDGLASYFCPSGPPVGDGAPFQQSSLLTKDSRYPSLPLLNGGETAAVGVPTASVAAATVEQFNSSAAVAAAFSLPNSPLSYSAARDNSGLVGPGAVTIASGYHRPHGFTPIMPAPPQDSSYAAAVIAAPTPVVMLPPSSTNPLVISPPQPPAIPVAYAPVMSPGILNTAFAPANPLLFSGAPLAAHLPTIVSSPPATSREDPTVSGVPGDIV